MANSRASSAYHLPPALLATPLQRLVPHDNYYDGFIFSSMRDRLITCRGQYDIHELITDMIPAVSIHEEDVLHPGNWELSGNLQHLFANHVFNFEIINTVQFYRILLAQVLVRHRGRRFSYRQ
jgi:hypothetical protein